MSRTGRQGGFTFIEAMAAVAILSIVLVGVVQSYSRALSAMEIARSGIDAIYVLKNRMTERLLEHAGEECISRGITQGVSAAGQREIKWSLDAVYLDPPEEGSDLFLIEIKGTAWDESARPRRDQVIYTYRIGEAEITVEE